MRIALGLEYNGFAYCGWQTQPSGCAIQDIVERALAQIAAHPVATTCAGRTDAGVHALGQVLHFDTDSERPTSAWTRGANALLPADISIRWAIPVEPDFHARYSATARRYVYYLQNRPQRPGLWHGKVGWFHRELDVERMREAAACLVGTHDFSAFRSSECQAASPVRTLRRLEIDRHGDLVKFDFSANAFLHHMVRNIVGALIYVGCTKRSPEWLAEILLRRNRAESAPTFAASGLYLEAVEYERKWRLPDASGANPLAGLAGSPD